MNKFYLKPNVVLEPLVDGWYAWSHLISPATAAMNTVNRHIKIMNSYVQAPEIHAAAVRNPKMKGGPFMDFETEKVKEVSKLKEETIKSRKKLIGFSEALYSLEELLKEKGTGHSLENLYEEVPDILKGYVELVYDLNNNASYRFFESLLYQSEFYQEDAQSIMLWLTENDERPFVLSTPRFENENSINLNIPFKSELIDKLCRMKKEKGDVDQIAKLLEISDNKMDVFRSFFTGDEPKKYKEYTGDKVRMRYFGHACILIETGELNVLIDPLISYYGYPQEIDRFSEMDLPSTIDYVLITHNHQDHILFETLLPLRHRIKNIVVPGRSNSSLQDPDLKLMFDKIGFENVIKVDELESLKFDDCLITGLPFIGEHCDLNIQTKMCFHLSVGGFTMLFLADSSNIEPRLYSHIVNFIGDVDVMFLGMECHGAPLTWLYGPLLTQNLDRELDQSRRLAGSDFEKARHLVETFNPSETYVYAMGQEPWLEFISSIKYTPDSHPIVQSDKLIQFCTEKNISAERLFGEKEIFYNRRKVKEIL